MAPRKKAATKAKKKSAARPAEKKAAKKSSTAKCATKRTTRSVVGKKTSEKRAAALGSVAIKKPMSVEPGPPPGNVPPVEEPTVREAAVGVVTHYYSHMGVAVVQVNTGELRAGDTIRVKGHTTDLTQQIASMEYEHQHIDQASPGQSVGIRIADHAREHDIVYVVK